MKRNVMMVLWLCLMVSVVFSTAEARETKKLKFGHDERLRIEPPRGYGVDRRPAGRGPHLAAANSTTYLAYYTFDTAEGCTPEGWTSHDLTEQTGDYWHVTDFATGGEACGPGYYGRLVVLEGNQSLWCGACSDPGNVILCSYSALPGYGNDWDQAFCTQACLTVESNVVVDYLAAWDSEPGYDATTVEIDNCDDNWVAVYGGIGVCDGAGSGFHSIAVPDSLHDGALRVRFHFVSDGGWSDQDALYDTDGAFILDSLSVSDAGGVVLAVEDFEDESVGDNNANDWESCTPPGYGDYAQLSSGLGILQEDDCQWNYSCVWNFFKGSTYNYSCRTNDPVPWQPVVPYGNDRGQYIWNEVWSPEIPLVGSGSVVEFSYDIYRDDYQSFLMFYTWGFRSIKDGCPGPWHGPCCWGYPPNRGWARYTQSVGWSIEPGTTHIQVAVGVVDLCIWQCPYFPPDECHSHAPLFDNVQVYRVAQEGPQYRWSGGDQFQDTFSSDGTTTGTARIDMAQDILPGFNPAVMLGDSAIIEVTDPVMGLATDLATGWGPAVYTYVDVHGGTYSPTAMLATEMRSGNVRWPHVGDQVIGGDTWHIFRTDSCFDSRGRLAANRYCIDFNDDLFVPGDTIFFFYGAENSVGDRNYYARGDRGYPAYLEPVYSPAEAAELADECTILPSKPTVEILYVDAAYSVDAQRSLDTSFESMGILGDVDRFDVRGRSYEDGIHLGGSVVDPIAQLSSVYKQIIWNCGNYYYGFSDGSGTPDDSDDTGVLKIFLDNLPNTAGPLVSGGVYLDGDHVADQWSSYTSASAQALRFYLSYNLLDRSHIDAGAGVSPWAVGTGAGTFPVADTVVAYGGCPWIKNFDVLGASGASVVEAIYVNALSGAPVGGAIVRQVTANPNGALVAFILSGFSFHQIRDHDHDGMPDRWNHLNNILAGLGDSYGPIIGLGQDARVNSLAQNYPNPFNPTTTITYTLKKPGHVSLRVYNVAGQLVKTLVDEMQRPDAVKPVHWDGRNNAGNRVSSGVYFYKLVTKGFTQTRKMVLLK